MLIQKKLLNRNLSGQTEIILMAVSAILILIVSIWAWKKYKIENTADILSETREPGFGKAIKNKFYVDEFYDAIIVKPLRSLSQVFK